MSKQEIIKVFGNRNIRSVWDDEAGEWYFAIAADGKMRMTDVADQEQYDEYETDFEYAC